MEVTKKELLSLAKALGAVELKAGDPEVAKVAKMHLRCVFFSWRACKCTGQIFRDKQGKFYVAKTHDAVCYVANS